MRNSLVIASVAAAVAALLLVGGWLLFGGRQPGTGAPGSGPPAPVTHLTWPPDPSGLPIASRPPDPYPTVPAAQVRAENHDPSVRIGDGGRQLLIPVLDSDCVREEVRLLGEHADSVEVEVRLTPGLPPPSVSVAPDGSYGCMGFRNGFGPHAVIELHAPLGGRPVIIHR